MQIVVNILIAKEDRRKILKKHASDLGFDPLIASNWYKTENQQLWHIEVTCSLFIHFVQSIHSFYLVIVRTLILYCHFTKIVNIKCLQI